MKITYFVGRGLYRRSTEERRDIADTLREIADSLESPGPVSAATSEIAAELAIVIVIDGGFHCEKDGTVRVVSDASR